MIINYLIDLFVFIFGVCIGSFLNCYIYRLEQEKTLNGRSFCPNCKHFLSWLDLFPVFSFLFLKGKCRYCKEKISIQYPLVELAGGILFLAIFNPHNILQSVFYWLISCFLIIIFVYDLKHYIIPDKILFPAIIITLVFNLIPPYNFHQIIFNFVGAAVASGFFLAIFVFSKGKWMGFGDVKLAILMGLLLGLANVLVALFLAFFFGAIIGVIMMVFEKKNLRSEIPFGPFLIAGTFSAIFFGSQIIQWYMSLFQI